MVTKITYTRWNTYTNLCLLPTKNLLILTELGNKKHRYDVKVTQSASWLNFSLFNLFVMVLYKHNLSSQVITVNQTQTKR